MNLDDFNLALFPESEDFQRQCIELAQVNCAGQSDGYLLGLDALPHVTVCQFKTEKSRLSAVWSAMSELRSVSYALGFRHIYLQYGKGELTGKSWLGLAVILEPLVLDLQKSVFQRLLNLGIESRNTPESYFPHLTFARLDATRSTQIVQAPRAEFWLERYSFRLTIGQSDEHGRYHEEVSSRL